MKYNYARPDCPPLTFEREFVLLTFLSLLLGTLLLAGMFDWNISYAMAASFGMATMAFMTLLVLEECFIKERMFAVKQRGPVHLVWTYIAICVMIAETLILVVIAELVAHGVSRF